MSVQRPNIDLVVLEQVFRLNVYVYDLQKTEAGDITARLV
jgi:hypothetical protein